VLSSTVEQEQIQKRTFTNWINAQLSKRKPPCAVLDLFSDLRDGSRLLDLLEVMSGQRMVSSVGELGAGFLPGKKQHRDSPIKLVNIHIPDIIDGKPSIILGLVWTIILHFHELASTLSFTSRQSSIESLASLDSNSVASSSSAPRHGSPLHTRFRISAKKALLLWVREQAGCTLNVKDFKSSWRSGVVFLAILHSLRPNLVDLSKAWNRTNRQNLEEAFRIAEKELHIPRLLEPADVDIRDPDEKSIMTYVAQFLQYSKEMPVSEEEMQVCLLSHGNKKYIPYSLESPLPHSIVVLSAFDLSPISISVAWHLQLRKYKTELDLNLPGPLDSVGHWLLRVEEVLATEIGDAQDHDQASQEARSKLDLLKVFISTFLFFLVLVLSF
uniref:Calponin-homology (CH) domain-containing protein n=1 Tax=Paramormyrops kingsleyae TaxID=1676925 RepID=A0A3B3QZV9_9TELE